MLYSKYALFLFKKNYLKMQKNIQIVSFSSDKNLVVFFKF